MSSITVKNIPEDTYWRLKRSAKAHHRSLNSEIIVCLEASVRSQRVDPEFFLARLDILQARQTLPPLTDELLESAKAERRP